MTASRRRIRRVIVLLAVQLIGSCSPPLLVTGASPSPPPGSAAARYLMIAIAGNKRLERDVDAFNGRDHANLDAARADLLDEAATEHEFDRQLMLIAFAPALEATAQALYRVNEDRATLTTEAAGAKSLAELRTFEPRLAAANASVEVQVRKIRQQLGLPPPETS